jgi:glycerol kinase
VKNYKNYIRMLYDYGFIVRRNLTGQLLLGLDLGTTLIKAVIFDTNGRIITSSEREVEVIYPKPGWAEQDPEVL